MALEVLLEMLNSYWLHKLVELRPSKHIGSNEPWYFGDLWQPVSDQYVEVQIFLQNKL